MSDEPSPTDAALLLEAAPDAIIAVDRRERILFANAAAAAMFGAAPSQLIKLQLGDLLPEWARPQHSTDAARYFDGPRHRPFGSGSRFVARRLDGTVLAVDIALSHVRLGGEVVVVAALRDRSAEEAARKAADVAAASAANARAQLDRTPDTILAVDPHGKISTVNAAWGRFARANGADAATIAGVGLNYVAACARSPDGYRVAAGMQQVLTGRSTGFDLRYRGNSPTELRRFLVRVEPLSMDASGNAAGALIIHRDVTASALAEERLAVQRSVAEALAAGRSLPEVCRTLGDELCRRLEWDMWEAWGTTTTNDGLRLLEVGVMSGVAFEPFVAATRAMAFSPGEDLVGRVASRRQPEWTLDVADDQTSARSGAARACGLRTALSVPLVSGDETFLMMSFFTRSRRAEDRATVDLVSSIGAQIAEVARRQRAEGAARVSAAEAEASRARLSAILENMPGIVLEVDREGVINYVNQTRGRPLSSLIGSTWPVLPTGEERRRLRGVLAGVIETGVPASFEVEFFEEGKALSFLGRIVPLRRKGLDGQTGPAGVVGAVILGQDVTELRRMSLELDAAQRLASVGALAAGVAHEINNPLSSVIANLALAAEEIAQVSGGSFDARELLAELSDAQQAADRIRGIARDLKALARPKEEEELGPVDAQAIFEENLRMANNEIRHRARVVRDYQDVPCVIAVEGRLGQVILNLLLNAAQAIPDGNAEANTIRVATRLGADGAVCLEVADTGAGISEADRERLFTPFFTTKAPGTGTGLGLSICDQIVRSFGGRIDVESALGQGATFRVWLQPARQQSLAPTPRTGTSPGEPIHCRRVLVIDDEEFVGIAIRRALAGSHEVTVASSGRDALALLDAGRTFDVILCDIMMPEVSGPALVEQLRRRLPSEAHKVVLITGGAFSTQARAYVDSTEHVVLEKPLRPQELRDLISRMPAAARL